MKIRLLPVALFLGLASTLAAVGAETIFDYTFEDGTTTGWTTGGAWQAVAVVNDPLRPSNKVLMLDNTNGAYANVQTVFEPQGEGTLRLTLQFFIADSGGGASPGVYGIDQYIGLEHRKTTASPANDYGVTYGRFYLSSSQPAINHYDGNGSGGGTWNTANRYFLEYGKWYEYTQTVTMDGQIADYEWALYNVTDAVAIGSGTIGKVNLGGESPDVGRLFLHPVSSSGGGLMYLDQVKLEVIPEATAAHLLLPAAFLLVAGNFYRRCR